MATIPEVSCFCNVKAGFAMVVYQSNLDDFPFLRPELDMSDETSITPYILETHRLRAT